MGSLRTVQVDYLDVIADLSLRDELFYPASSRILVRN